MPNTTPNLGLIKPLVTEQYDIAKVTNENADKIDLLLAPKANPTFTGTQTLPNIVTNGIKFPATQVPIADPNTFDDYEEGTFTPTIIGGTTAGVGTYIAQGGHYTKLGNFVHCDIVLATSAHTGTGDMKISGLPFTTKNVASYRATANIGYISGISVTTGSIIVGRCLANVSEISLEMIKDGTVSGVLQIDPTLTMYLSIDYLTN